MGKAQVKKKTDASRRHNPIRVPDSHLGGGRGEGKNPAKERQMLPILDKVSLPSLVSSSVASCCCLPCQGKKASGSSHNRSLLFRKDLVV